MSNNKIAHFIADDTLSTLSLISGTSGDDILSGDSGDNEIEGLGGNDKLSGYEGNDSLNGGRGLDRLFGGSGDDSLSGGAGNDELYGDAGADVLIGGGGNDRISGGFESDTLKGGAGQDQFVMGQFQTNSQGQPGLWVDTILDFSVTDDQIYLSPFAFPSVPVLGTLDPSAFCANTSGKAEDSQDRIIYNTGTGELYYDADGSGAGAAVQFALIGTKNHAALTADDFVGGYVIVVPG